MGQAGVGGDGKAGTGTCGDGIVTAPEHCDGADPAGVSCTDLGFDVGEVRCSDLCTYDGSTCEHTFSQVSAGDEHTCAVKTDGTVACWGDDFYGQATPPAGTFSQVSSGEFHTCGVRTDGTAACWGNDDAGRATPPTGTFSQVSAGGDHTCGVQTDGTVECLGFDEFGQATLSAAG